MSYKLINLQVQVLVTVAWCRSALCRNTGNGKHTRHVAPPYIVVYYIIKHCYSMTFYSLGYMADLS